MDVQVNVLVLMVQVRQLLNALGTALNVRFRCSSPHGMQSVPDTCTSTPDICVISGYFCQHTLRLSACCTEGHHALSECMHEALSSECCHAGHIVTLQEDRQQELSHIAGSGGADKL